MTRTTPARSLLAFLAATLVALASLTPANAAPPCAPVVTSRDAISTTLTSCGATLIADAGPLAAPASTAATAGTATSQVATGADPIALSSRPGAPNTIYLDFTGATVTGTLWNSALGEYPAVFASFDMDKDPASFSAEENTVIARTWELVVADFAPFDVNVTTVDPGPGGPSRGIRALMTSSVGHNLSGCLKCTGWAYLNTYPSAALPALVYTDLLYSSPIYLAQTVSHEIGHTLGLRHDGGSGKEYQQSNDVWNPIMGGPTVSPLSTWSNGDYVNASNAEDDLAIIGSQLGHLPDDFLVTSATATEQNPLPILTSPATGLISGPADTDAFAITAKAGTKIAITPAVDGGNLDVAATLTAADGTVVAESRPVTTFERDENGNATFVYDANGKLVVHFDASVAIPATGTYTLTVTASSNRDGVSAPFAIGQNSTYGVNGVYTIAVTPPKVITPTIVTRAVNLTRGKAANVTLKITGGKPAYYVSFRGAKLPTGLKLSSRGVLTGKATRAGTVKVTVTVFDMNLAATSAVVTFTVR